ncbi:unnamed protein product [Amoebophrya sp. A120]|nr:unnamed protein product [Amoebophrya sp. A120]|eukprot:GSA120T00012571001.1
MSTVLNLWSYTSQLLYCLINVIIIVGIWSSHMTENQGGVIPLLKGPIGLPLLLLFDLLAIQPCSAPWKLRAAVLSNVMLYGLWAAVGGVYLRVVFPALQTLTEESDILRKTLFEVLLATVFFSIWVPIGSKKCGAAYLFSLVKATAFLQGEQELSPEEKYDLECFARILCNGALDLYRYGYGRGALLKVSPSAFAIVVAKDVFYDIMHFGLGFSAEWQCFKMKLDATNGRLHRDTVLPAKFKLFRLIDSFTRRFVFNRIDTATAIPVTWMYAIDCEIESQRLGLDTNTITGDTRGGEPTQNGRGSDDTSNVVPSLIDGHDGKMNKPGKTSTNSASTLLEAAVANNNKGRIKDDDYASVGSEQENHRRTCDDKTISVEGAGDNRSCLAKPSNIAVPEEMQNQNRRSSLVQDLKRISAAASSSGEMHRPIGTTGAPPPRKSYSNYDISTAAMLCSLTTDPFGATSTAKKPKQTSVAAQQENKMKTGNTSNTRDVNAHVSSAVSGKISATTADGTATVKRKENAKQRISTRNPQGRPASSSNDVVNVEAFEVEDEDTQVNVSSTGTVSTYERIFQFANHRIVARKVPRLEPCMVVPGRKMRCPITIADLQRVRPLLVYVQQENFARFQSRMFARIFTAAVVFFSPCVVILFGDAPFFPGFQRSDVESRQGQASLDGEYMTYASIFLLTDLLSYFVVTLGVHLNEDCALVPWRELVGDFFTMIDRCSWQRLLKVWWAFGAYFALLIVINNWDPYRNKGILDASGIDDKGLDFAPHIYRVCGAPSWLPRSYNP